MHHAVQPGGNQGDLVPGGIRQGTYASFLLLQGEEGIFRGHSQVQGTLFHYQTTALRMAQYALQALVGQQSFRIALALALDVVLFQNVAVDDAQRRGGHR